MKICCTQHSKSNTSYTYFFITIFEVKYVFHIINQISKLKDHLFYLIKPYLRVNEHV